MCNDCKWTSCKCNFTDDCSLSFTQSGEIIPNILLSIDQMGAEALRSIEIQSFSSENKENVIAISETVSLQKPTTAIDSVQVNMKLLEEAQPTNSKAPTLRVLTSSNNASS